MEFEIGADEAEVHPEAAVAPGFLSTRAAQIFNRKADDALRDHGLSLALLGPLLLIHWKGPMLQRDIVRHSAVRQPAMVAMLDKLERQKLIKRSAVAADGRAAMIELTQAGCEAALKGGDLLRDLNAIGLAGFSIEEIALLISLTQRFGDNLEQSPGPKYHK